ncbi:hypothetical protein AB0O00_30160, partial [Kitasatospora sp. NPDC093558]
MSLPGADELFRTTGGMALSPSLAPRPAAEASRPETARAGNGRDGAEGTQDAQGTGETGRQSSPQDQQAATVPAPAQPPVQRSVVAPAGKTVQGGRGAAATPAGAPATARHAGTAED